MNSNQQLSDYIYYYPEAMDSKTCNTIIKHFDTKAEWKQSTFATAGTNTGSSKVSMEEFWIGSPLPYYKDIEKSFKYCVRFQADLIGFNSNPQRDIDDVVRRLVLIIKDHSTKFAWCRPLRRKTSALVKHELIKLLNEVG